MGRGCLGGIRQVDEGPGMHSGPLKTQHLAQMQEAQISIHRRQLAVWCIGWITLTGGLPHSK